MSEYGYKWVVAMEQFAKSAQQAAQMLRETFPEPEPAKAEQPERFEHRDIDGDRVLVYPHVYPEFQSLLMVETDGDSVRLSQEAVNGLAQYLDQYRTDQTECDVELAEQCGWANPFRVTGCTNGAPEPREHWCGRHSDHPDYEYVLNRRSMRCLGVSNKVYGS